MNVTNEDKSPHAWQDFGSAPSLSNTTRKLLIANSTCEKAIAAAHALEDGVYDALFYSGVISYYSSMSPLEERILQAFMTYPDIDSKLAITNDELEKMQTIRDNIEPAVRYALTHNTTSCNDYQTLRSVYEKWKDIRNKTVAHTENKHEYELSKIRVKLPFLLHDRDATIDKYITVDGWPQIKPRDRQEFIMLIGVTAIIFLARDGIYEQFRSM